MKFYGREKQRKDLHRLFFACSFALKALMKKATRGEKTGLASGKAA